MLLQVMSQVAKKVLEHVIRKLLENHLPKLWLHRDHQSINGLPMLQQHLRIGERLCLGFTLLEFLRYVVDPPSLRDCIVAHIHAHA